MITYFIKGVSSTSLFAYFSFLLSDNIKTQVGIISSIEIIVPMTVIVFSMPINFFPLFLMKYFYFYHKQNLLSMKGLHLRIKQTFYFINNIIGIRINTGCLVNIRYLLKGINISIITYGVNWNLTFLN